jgi:hypothetical protein
MPKEPRPTCPECGEVVDPRTCISVNEREDPAFNRTLAGIYCSQDCAIDAVDRGRPAHGRAKELDIDEERDVRF